MSTALIIDDNRQTAEALLEILTLWGMDGRLALNPSTAMVLLNEIIPAIVFLDINMPGVDGFEVLAYLRREPRLADVPVIIITSDDQPETAKRAISNGASAVVIKPVMPDILEETLKRIGMLKS